MKIPELLAPAGNLERLKVAVLYGADAVYIGGKQFGLRAFADNFESEEMEEGVEFAHKHGKRLYVTMNIFPHNRDFEGMEDYVKYLRRIGVDAIILSDPGVLDLVKNTAPDMEIHLSTQANNTNWMSASFWYRQGVHRIILARELSLEEIKETISKSPADLEFEAFVHGAMCISYSGRCYLSHYLTGRDANRGACTQPCRWKYYLMEEKRPGEYMPVFEDDRGTYIMNSRDLCMVGHIPELVQSGLASLKIEGRMKTSFYVATVVQAYRKELDAYARDPESYRFDEKTMEEIKKASHRPYTTGFYFRRPTPEDQEVENSKYVREYDFVGMVLGYDEEEKLLVVEQRNPFSVGDELEIISPYREYISYKVTQMLDENKEPIEICPHPQQKLYLPMDMPLEPYSILRKKKE